MVPSPPGALPALPGAAGAVVAACSGGLDSTVLLHRLAADAAIRARGLRALHVHHGLHPRADEWADHCRAQCAALDVPLRVERVHVDHGAGLGPEAAARVARHAAFAAALGPGEVIALAHHRDDQAETFLLRALRASGPGGLAAMRPWRRFAAGWMWRPLLDEPRAALETWARERGLAWIEDPANADPAHARSLLRHRLMPLLRGRWPGADAAFARSAALCAEAEAVLDDHDQALVDLLLQGDGAASGALPLAGLRPLPPAVRARVLRAWAARAGLPPLPAAGVRAIDAMLGARRDRQAEFRWAGAAVRAWRGALHPLDAPVGAAPADWSLDWDGRAPLALPPGGRLALVGAGGFERIVRVHARRGGERLRLPGRAHSHALKHLLQDAAVPPWERARMPLLSAPDGSLLAAGDALLSGVLHDWLAARGARLEWTRLA